MKKLLCISLMLILGIVFVACGKTGDVDGVALTFYRGQESGMVIGKDDETVKKAIEEKFFNDTGVKINLTVNLYAGNELGDKVESNWSKKSADMDGVIHYLGEDSSMLLKYGRVANTVHEVDDILQNSGSKVLEAIRKNDTNHIGERSAYVPVGDAYKMNIIPGVTNEKAYGILIRKDYMEKVKGITGVDPELYDTMNEEYQNLKFSDFEKVLYAIKENISEVSNGYPIEGTAWDLNRVLAPVFGTDLYNWQVDENGNYVPAQFTKGSAEMMDYMWKWAKAGVWERESGSRTDTRRLQDFINGWSACYITYPTADNLINAARKLKQVNSGAEYMLLAPLADESGTVNGFQKVNRSFNGMILPIKSTDAEVTVQYLNWMYSSVENYELCLYGIKGVHWEDGEVITFEDKEYKTWKYPDSKTDEYNENPPYSGAYCLLKNINVSNRIRSDYNTVEKTWYFNCIDQFEMYVSNPAEGVWAKNVPKGELSVQANSVDGNFVNSIRGKCWSGDGSVPISTLLEAYVNEQRRDAGGYLDYLNTSIKDSLNYFSELFKG